MAPHDLHRALSLEPSGEGIWMVRADPHYESSNGMFGGWTAAVALKTVADSAAGTWAPCVMTLNFINKIEAGSTLCIRSWRVGGGRSIDHWQVELTTEDQQTPLAGASFILAERRDSD